MEPRRRIIKYDDHHWSLCLHLRGNFIAFKRDDKRGTFIFQKTAQGLKDTPAPTESIIFPRLQGQKGYIHDILKRNGDAPNRSMEIILNGI